MLDDTKMWSYIRVTFIENMVVSYNPSCYLDEMYVYGGKEVSNVVKRYYFGASGILRELEEVDVEDDNSSTSP